MAVPPIPASGLGRTVPMLSRREMLVGAAALSGLPAAAQAQATYGSIAVDVGPLRQKGLGPYAEQVGAIVRDELQRQFADRVGRGGPRLVVRIDAISLRAYAGSETRPFSSGAPNDYLEGEALVVSPKGEVLLRHPQLSALPSSSGGAWYLPGSEERRLQALAAHFAGWLRRALG